jgi:1-acyl-sn-glycerol-3-phosphate acyltransferase
MMQTTGVGHWVRFAVTGFGMVVNAIVLPTILMLTALLRALPIRPVQVFSQHLAVAIAQTWIAINSALFRWFLPTKITGSVPDSVQAHRSYLVVSNHQSWVDIVVLQAMFNRKAPFFRFFLKQELIWVPIMGLAWWVLDFPFMKRLTKEQIAKNPELKNRDKDEAIRRMQKFQNIPVGIMLFLEGTRFTQAKHDKQQSPFEHLLKPRAAGAAYALSVLSDKLDQVIDATISYPHGVPTFVEFLMGKCPEIHVDVQVREIPLTLRQGNYETDKAFRVEFQNWVNGMWQEKDAQLTRIANPK